MTKNSPRWIITGGSGFIGQNLIHHLVATGIPACNIISVDTSGRKPHKNINHVIADIQEQATLEKALESGDIVIHLAAATSVQGSLENPAIDFDTNVTGTKNLLQALTKSRPKRLIFASTVAGFASDQAVHEDTPAKPLSPYGENKLAAERLCLEELAENGLPVSVLRLTNVYGPRFGSSDALIPQAIRAGVQQIPFNLFGDGTVTRDFVYVGDLCRAIIRIANSPWQDSHSLFQIASGKPCRVHDVLERIDRHLAERGFQPLQITKNPARQGEVSVSFGDASKAGQLLGWQPETSFTDGIGKTIDWYIHDSGLVPGSR